MNKPIYARLPFKIIAAVLTIVGLFLGLLMYYTTPRYAALAPQHHEFLLKQFTADQHWLTYSPSITPKSLLYNITTPAHSNKYGQDVHTNVLMDNGQQAAFVSYYMEKFNTGRVLFLSVDPAFRGKGYGAELFKFAMGELEKMGAKRLRTTTRTANTWARRIYDRLGFKLVEDDGTFVQYEKRV